jgi:hypothetical protein
MSIKHFDKVELLLPMTGANNGTVFTDYSARKRVVTVSGNAKTSTAHSITGYASSGYFDGTGDFLTVPMSGMEIGTSDFTIEYWVRWDALKAATHFDFRGGGTQTSPRPAVYILNGETILRYFVNGADRIVSGSNLAVTTWQHIAICRVSGTTRMFIGGVQVGNSWSDSTNYTSGTTGFVAKNDITGYDYNGYMCDFSVSLEGKYASDFTPPPRMTQRELTRTNTGTDSHEFDRAVLFDWAGSAYALRTVTPNASGDFTATNLIDLDYGVALIKEGCDPVCRGPVAVDED